MASFSRSIDVAQPPEAVFGWLLEEDRVPQWTGHLESYEHLTGGAVREGSRLRQTLELSGSRFTVDIDVVRYDPPRSAESRFTTNGVEVVNVYALEPTPTGTRVTQTMEAKAKSLGARMLIPVVQPRLERKLGEDLERLRALLDGGG